MSFTNIGLDFLGGGMEGAGSGATVAAGLNAAGIAAGPYAVPLMAGMAGVGALSRILSGFADQPAERMNMRLGSQQIQMNDLEIAARKRQQDEERKAIRKNRAFQDILSGIFSKYNSMRAPA